MSRATILITAHNVERFIAESVRSALAQTEPNLRIIIIDDGSSDGTLNIIRQTVADDARVRIITGPNRGFTRVLHETIPTVETPYFGWLDGDDCLEPAAVQKCADALDGNANASFVYTGYSHMNAAGQVIGAGSRTKVPFDKMRMLVDFMTFHFRLIRKTAYEAVGGIDPSFVTAQDYDLCLKLAEAGDVAHVPELLYRYRVHDRMTSTQRRVEQIESSRRAIEAALKRRGLDRTYKIDVEIVGRFTLAPRGG